MQAGLMTAEQSCCTHPGVIAHRHKAGRNERQWASSTGSFNDLRTVAWKRFHWNRFLRGSQDSPRDAAADCDRHLTIW